MVVTRLWLTAGVLVVQGFWAAYQSIQAVLVMMVKRSLKAAGPDVRLYTTGHSLGGALASLAAFELTPVVKKVRPPHPAAPV